VALPTRKQFAKAAATQADRTRLTVCVAPEVPAPKSNPRDRSPKWQPRATSDLTVYSVKRRDAERHEAEMAQPQGWIAEQTHREERNALADEYQDELRTNGRPTSFRTQASRVTYMAQWGADSPRGRAFRERQRERGLPEADPARIAGGGAYIAPGGGLVTIPSRNEYAGNPSRGSRS
jgi:hypothetical protein